MPKAMTKQEETPDGFRTVELTINMNLPCKRCGKHPRRFWYRPAPGKVTEVYCIPCKSA